MYKRFLTIAASIAVAWGVACPLPASAQAQPPAQPSTRANTASPPGHGMHRGPGMNPEEQLEHLSRALNLTDTQKSQIKPILEGMHKQTERIRAESSLPRQERRRKIHGVIEEGHAKVRALLTNEQKQKLDQIREHRGEHRPRPPTGASH